MCCELDRLPPGTALVFARTGWYAADMPRVTADQFQFPKLVLVLGLALPSCKDEPEPEPEPVPHSKKFGEQCDKATANSFDNECEVGLICETWGACDVGFCTLPCKTNDDCPENGFCSGETECFWYCDDFAGPNDDNTCPETFAAELYCHRSGCGAVSRDPECGKLHPLDDDG